MRDECELFFHLGRLDRFFDKRLIVTRRIAFGDDRRVGLCRRRVYVDVNAKSGKNHWKFWRHENHAVVASDKTQLSAGLVAYVVAKDRMAKSHPRSPSGKRLD